MKRISARFSALACLATLALSAPASAELIYGIANVGNSTALLTWDSASPGNIISSKFLSGNGLSGSVVGIDFRPATGELFGLTSASELVTINTANGVVASVSGPFAPSLNGFNFGFDFNPTIDRIRVVAETNKNLVLNPITGALQLSATDLSYGPADPNFGVDPNVVHSAYSNNFVGAPSSQLYGIDTALDILVRQANNTGVLDTVGPLGAAVGALGGFDISGVTGTAYAAMLPSNSSNSRFYSINLATGLTTDLGEIDGGIIITAMTIAPAPVPEPATLAMAATSLAVGAIAYRRRRAA